MSKIIPGFEPLSPQALVIVREIIGMLNIRKLSRQDAIDVAASILISISANLVDHSDQLKFIALFNQRMQDAIDTIHSGKRRTLQ